MGELSGSKRTGQTTGKASDNASDNASTASGIEAADTGRLWFDAAQRFFPLPQLGNTFEAPLNVFTKPDDGNPFLSAFIQSSRQRSLLDGWQRENANYQQELMKYQVFCSEVFQESFQRISKHLENNQERLNERELFDLWIDTAEETYAEKTQDDNFETLIGNLINAIARVRQQYNLINQEVLAIFNLPDRSEISDAHEEVKSMRARISELETRVENLNKRLEIMDADAAVAKPPAKKVRKKHVPVRTKKKRKKTI